MKPEFLREGFLKTMLQCFAVICVCAMLLSAAAAALILSGALDRQYIQTAACCISAMAVFTGAFFAARRSPRQKLPAALAAAGCYLAVCLLARLLFFAAEEGSLLPGCVSIAAAALLAGLIGRTKPAVSRRRRR